MRPPDDRARELAETLAKALGTEPRITQLARSIRVEADVPPEAGFAIFDGVLAAIAAADRYGHEFTHETSTFWVEVHKRSPSPTRPSRPRRPGSR